MKKLALTIICSLTVAGVAFGQANLVSFTPTRTIISFETNATVISPLFGGGAANGGTGVLGNPVGGLQYDFTLLYQAQSGYQALATDTSVWDGTWQDTGLTATNTTAFATSGAIGSVGPTATSVPWSAPTTNSIVLVGWSANLAALDAGPNTWANVSNILANWNSTYLAIAAATGQNYFFGESAFGYIQPATSPAPGAAIFGTSSNSSGQQIGGLLTPLYLLPVPEPTTIALAGLGGLSLLLFRRRKV